MPKNPVAFRFTRQKYNAKPTERDGFRFDSMIEADFYDYLKQQTLDGHLLHIDVHPVMTLSDGIRKTFDFMGWYRDGRVTVYDVKGGRMTAGASAFRGVMKRWNHPGAELVAITRHKKVWAEWT